MMLRAGLLLALGLGLWSSMGEAKAQNFDAKLFDPVISPYGVFGVHRSRPMGHLSLYGRLMSNYANDLVMLYRGTDIRKVPEEQIRRPIAHRLTTELGLALGLFELGEVSLSLPVYLYQATSRYTPSAPNGQLTDDSKGGTLVGDMRLLVKGRILDNRKFGGFGLAVAVELSIPTGTDDELAGDESITLTPRLVLDYAHKSGWALAFNFAYRFRPDRRDPKFYTLDIDDELRFSLGTEIPLRFGQLSLLGELLLVVGLPQFGPNLATPQANLATEARIGIRWRHASGLILSLGAGFALTGGFGAPDFRLVFDIAFGRNVLTGKASDYIDTTPRIAKVVPRRPPPARPSPPRPRPAVVRAPPPQREPPALSAAAFDKLASTDPDPDGDGIPNSRDKCPNQPEDFDGFQDDDGCPDPDNDKDGIPDTVDKCPNQPETVNGVDDDDGCPDKGKAKVILAAGQIKIQEKVYFNSGSDELKVRSHGILKQVAAFIKANWQVRSILIEGHTDSRGDREMNVDLSERRARRVRAFLIQQGVKAWKLKAKGYGPKHPLASNSSGKGRAKNRRVAFKVLKVFVPKKKKGGTP